ncbi:MAG: hypothetical protein QXY22_04560 [Candidatus Nitrosotenuis sp.]
MEKQNKKTTKTESENISNEKSFSNILNNNSLLTTQKWKLGGFRFP